MLTAKQTQKIADIDHLVTDVDGVFTDGKFVYSNLGKEYKVFGAHDSDGIRLIERLGISIHAITADRRGFGITKKRLTDMGVSLTLVPEKERLSWMQERYSCQDTIFVGDGVFDALVMKQGFFGIAPLNATKITKQYAQLVLDVSGGNGVFFAVADVLYQCRGLDILSELASD